MFADLMLSVAWGLEISSTGGRRRRLGVNEFNRQSPWRMRPTGEVENPLVHGP